MAGNIPFRESLEERIKILKAHKNHLAPLIEDLKQSVSKSFKRNREFLETHAENILIISNGFKDFIDPIVAEYGIKAENVYANNFEYDEEGYITGFDKENVLSKDGGKVALLKEMELEGDVVVIGDGHNDYLIREAGLAARFFAFTENVERQTVLEKADHITPSLDEFLYVHKMNKAISYPKNRIRVLLLEDIHEEAFDVLKEEGYTVTEIKGSPSEDELAEMIEKVSILGVGTKTRITKKVLSRAKRLMAIGAYCIGTEHIDLDACQQKGVAVFNAPFSKARSVVELALAQMILLNRNIPSKLEEMKQGKWNRLIHNSFEIRGKNLGIIGYGNIGSQLSVLAEALGMKVYFYDKAEKLALGNATQCTSMEELLSVSDIVSLHVNRSDSNRNLISQKEFEAMRNGVILLNLGTGRAVDHEALLHYLENGKVRGVAIDAFPSEPERTEDEFHTDLIKYPNVLLTPHIAGNTEEAHVNIANFVPAKIMRYINTGSTDHSVNFPNLQLPSLENGHRLIHIHHNVPGILAHINNVLADHNINILGQYLKTTNLIGYVITDIDKEYSEEVINNLKAIEHTIRFRILY
jgi:D-3-phosphoglycerate dehydrogenase